MNARGQQMCQKIRDATYEFIENDAPVQYREIVKPNYEPSCKRRVNTATYFSTLHSPQMQLTKDQVVEIGPDHVLTKTGDRYPAVAIVYATGFLTHKWLFPMEIKGGTVVTDFPTLFVLYGPNAATGKHSVIFHSQCRIDYSCRRLRRVLKEQADSITMKPIAQKRDLTWVHQKLQGLALNSGCQSWWRDPVSKKNTFIYPDPMYKYWMRTIFPRWSDLRDSREQVELFVFRGCTWHCAFSGCIDSAAY